MIDVQQRRRLVKCVLDYIPDLECVDLLYISPHAAWKRGLVECRRGTWYHEDGSHILSGFVNVYGPLKEEAIPLYVHNSCRGLFPHVLAYSRHFVVLPTPRSVCLTTMPCDIDKADARHFENVTGVAVKNLKPTAFYFYKDKWKVYDIPVKIRCNP